MSVDQLLAKALSTQHEPEAITCFLMARKRNTKTYTGNIGNDKYRGKSAEA